jgi:3'(2'), 5'-bisphosphate nucleotidase
VSESDATLAMDLARAAGDVLLALRHSGVFVGPELGALGDAVSHRLLMASLRSRRPDDGILSEEGIADPSRFGHARVWIVDPLDGTREYQEGREDWAVHVALCLDGEPGPAAVAIPARGQVFGTDTGRRPTPAADTARRTAAPRIAVSRSRPPAEARHVADALGAELIPLGSAGAKAMAVLTGEVDAYIHSGGQYEWDSAAPVGVVLAAGLHASRIDGSPLRYNQPDPTLPDLLICRRGLAARLLSALADAGSVAG